MCVCVGGLEYLIKKSNQNRLQNTFSALISLRTVVWWVGLELLLFTLVSCEFSLSCMVHCVTVQLIFGGVNPLLLLFVVSTERCIFRGVCVFIIYLVDLRSLEKLGQSQKYKLRGECLLSYHGCVMGLGQEERHHRAASAGCCL